MNIEDNNTYKQTNEELWYYDEGDSHEKLDKNFILCIEEHQ